MEVKLRTTYRLHHVTPLEPAHLVSAHLHLVLPAPVLHAVHPLFLILCAILQSCLANRFFPLFVRLQDTHQLLMVGRCLGFDLGKWLIVLPNMGISSVLIQTRRGNGWLL
jgi:hypothetical protein